MKRVSVIFLALMVAVLATFIGCQKQETEATTTDNATKETTQAPQETTEKNASEAEYSPMVLTVFLATYAGQLLPGARSYVENAMADVNVTVEWHDVDQSVWAEQAQVMIASQNILDIMAFPDQTTTETAINLGVIVPVTDIIENSPKFNTIPESVLEKYRHPNGNIYTTAMYNYDTVDLMYRKDWADKLGLETPSNVDDLYNFMLAMVQQDPDGNGIDDTYGFVFKKGWTSAAPLIAAFLPETFTESLGFHYDSDGNMQNIFDDRDAWIKMLTWFQNAYKDGIFSEDFMQDTKSSAETKFVSGHSGLWPKNGIYIGSRLQTMRENFPEGEIVALPAIECYMPEYGVNMNIQAGPGSSVYDDVVHLTTFCDDIERGKLFLETFDSWEGQLAWWLGAEGESYDLVDGEYVFKEEEYLLNINLGDLMANPWGNSIPFYRDVDKEVEAAVKYIVSTADSVVSVAPVVQKSESYLTYAADIQAAIDQFLVEVCISEKNPEDFDAFLQSLYDNFNLQVVIDEVTAAAAK